MKKIFKIITFVLSTIFITSITSLFCYGLFSIQSLSEPEIERILQKDYTVILDSSNREIETLGYNKKEYIDYNEIPRILINALISVEDNEFFYHQGINYNRIISSFFHNITSSSTQGGSTLTQQLVKNLLLSNDKSLKRKIQEAYLSILLEKKMSKEEILEFYFNEIYFESTIPGIKYAAKRFFNKQVSQLNLPECALLVGLVKSPSYYNPFNHVDRAEKRKNIVLKTMLDNKYITYEQYNLAINKHINELLITKGSSYKEETYDYQSYLDIVYKEVETLTGYNPFSTPLIIETYLDTSIQSYLDDIQKGNVFNFKDEYQQIGSCIIDNNNSSIIGVIGGRNYDGKLLYNRAFDMKRQPASTMKPIFTYALAMEHLDYHEYTMIEDKPYTYPGTSTTVHNADKSYMGLITLTDAIGYSRNTSTLYTLEKVINKIGLEACISYLKDINLMDDGVFSYPYAIGGMKYGVSPTALAGAYSLLPRDGNYLKPSTIKSVKNKITGEILYSRSLEGKQIISKESAYLINSTLNKVINQNYYNISYAKPDGIKVCAKTGTNAYDKTVIGKYSYPTYADRDAWFVGYSKNYTIASWTGFDEPLKDKQTYFGRNDNRRLIVKDIFRETLKRLELKNISFNKPSSIEEISIIKGIPGNYLPNEYIPSSHIVKASFKQSNKPTQTLPPPTFNKINGLNIIADDLNLEIDIEHNLKNDLYEYIFSKKGYQLLYEDENSLDIYFSSSPHFTIPNKKKSFTISICETYENNRQLTGEIFTFSY